MFFQYKIKIIAFILLTSVLSINTAFAYNPLNIAGYRGYDGEGGFVEGAAFAGDVTGIFIVGTLAAVITEPGRLILPNADFNDAMGYTITKGGTKGFGCVFGAVPWCLKKVFYDIWVGYEPVVKKKAQPQIPHQLLYKVPVTKVSNLAVTEKQSNAPTAAESDVLKPEKGLSEVKTPKLSESLPELSKLPEPESVTVPEEETKPVKREKPKTDVLQLKKADAKEDESKPAETKIKPDSSLPSWLTTEIEQVNDKLQK